mmetsp:Transcript_46663/g.108755  ORF Transcript_46663/g.108755 Transcript_46663/m.108755 type:complete len:299 (-) Transcript_46663:1088-1984(-)
MLKTDDPSPQSATIDMALLVALRKSALAPELTSSGRKSTSSATLPPKSTQRDAQQPCLVTNPIGNTPAASSDSGSKTVTPPIPPMRGRIEARDTCLCVIGANATPRTTCPASCAAVNRLASSLRTGLAFSNPSKILSDARAMQSLEIASKRFFAASSAASLSKLLSSAPLKPTACLATFSKRTSAANGFPLACSCNTSYLPAASGKSNVTRRSKRPGRNNAGSRTSDLFVAATTNMSLRSSKPSISTKICSKVFSRSCSAPLAEASRRLPTASNSSMKTMQGCSFLADANSRFTSCVP